MKAESSGDCLKGGEWSTRREQDRDPLGSTMSTHPDIQMDSFLLDKKSPKLVSLHLTTLFTSVIMMGRCTPGLVRSQILHLQQKSLVKKKTNLLLLFSKLGLCLVWKLLSENVSNSVFNVLWHLLGVTVLESVFTNSSLTASSSPPLFSHRLPGDVKATVLLQGDFS